MANESLPKGRVRLEPGDPTSQAPGSLWRDNQFRIWYRSGDTPVVVYPPERSASAPAQNVQAVSGAELPVQGYWPGMLVEKTNLAVYYPMTAGILHHVVLTLCTAPVGLPVKVNVLVRGTVVAEITIPLLSIVGIAANLNIAFNAADKLSIDVTQASSGADMTVMWE